jgi:uncharacterized membrane protein YphA (DoxX/SURF4 family)
VSAVAVAHDPVVHLVMRLSLALLFATAARHKLGDLPRFRATLHAYRVLPAVTVAAAAVATVGAELVVAAALLLPWTRAGAALGAAVLLTVYTAAIVVNLARGRGDIDCGCGGPAARQPLSGWLVARNVALVGVALATLASVDARVLVWPDWLTVGGAVGALALAWDAAHRLVAGWARMRPYLEAR